MMKTLYSRKEAAAILGISVGTLDTERREGRLAYVQRKVNGKVWVTETAIQEYIARGTRQAKPVRSGRI